MRAVPGGIERELQRHAAIRQGEFRGEFSVNVVGTMRSDSVMSFPSCT